jgi:signal transduction histidine kinase
MRALAWTLPTLAWLLLLMPGPLAAQNTATSVDSTLLGPATLTAVAQLDRFSVTNPQFLARLEAAVRWVNQESGLIVLEDATGLALISVDLTNQRVEPGRKIRLEGCGLREQGRVTISSRLLIDNNGLHAATEKSGSLHLTPGRYPVVVSYFNGLQDYVLRIEYEGPNLPRQLIPDAVLVHPEVAGGQTNWIAGLTFACVEGSWSLVPDFRQTARVKTGVIPNFDLGVRTRADNFGVEFRGYILVAAEGVYKFYATSDDGCQMLVGDSTSTLTDLGNATLPPLVKVVAGQVLPPNVSSLWSEVEGTIITTGGIRDRMEAELNGLTGRMRIEIAEAFPGYQFLLPHSRVRLRGVTLGRDDGDGQVAAGFMQVPSLNEITILAVPQEDWQQVPLTTVRDLHQTNLVPTFQGLVRLTGTIKSSAISGMLTIEDDTGDVPVENLSRSLIGQRIELLALPKVKNSTTWLRGIVNRSIPDAAVGREYLPLLTTVEQVRRLGQTEAQRSYPFRVRGVVTYRSELFGMIQDDTGGVFAFDFPPDARYGDYYELEGVTDPGGFAPSLRCRTARLLGHGPLPYPLHPTWEEIMSGGLDSQWVEVQGLVLKSTNTDGILMLSRNDGDTRIELMEFDLDAKKRLEGGVVCVRGTVHSQYDGDSHRILSGSVRAQSLADVTLITPPLTDNSVVLEKRVTDLSMFDPRLSPFKPVKVTGTVVNCRDGTGALMDGTNGLRFVLREPVALKLGDKIELVGFPGMSGQTPVFRNCVARKLGVATLPSPVKLEAATALEGSHDATLVRIEARLVNLASNKTEQVLELQAGTRSFIARLPNNDGGWRPEPLGSELDLSGVLACHLRGGDSTHDSFELWLNSSADITVLSRPSWWTIRRTLTLAAALTLVLLATLAWIRTLRLQVEERTQQLQDEIEQHKRTERKLETEIEERKRMQDEIDRVHRQLLDASHQAGMAEVATGILHNVGNVLNSVNVAANLVSDQVRNSRSPGVRKLAKLVHEHADELPRFFTQDPRGQQIPGYLANLGDQLDREQTSLMTELESLSRHVNHVKEIVSMQQSYARTVGLMESVMISGLVEDALKIHADAFQRHTIKVKCDLAPMPAVITDRHKVLQILINLLSNAKYACEGNGKSDKLIEIKTCLLPDQTLQLQVRDNGIGIPPENLTKIFMHGFTTRKTGHGFGLHSCANAAKEMGGALTAHSDGPGQGAQFLLELPVKTAAAI